jgi:hypothetical protein
VSDLLNAYAEGRGFKRGGFGHPFHGMLAGHIDRCTGGPLVAISRGDVDYAPGALGLHYAQLVLHAEQCAQQIGILLSPIIAAAAMALSSVSVISNALRLGTVAID